MAADQQLQALIKKLGITKVDSDAKLPLVLFSRMSCEVYDLIREPSKFKSDLNCLQWEWEPHFVEAGWAECIGQADSDFHNMVVLVFKGTADLTDFVVEDIPHIGLTSFPLDIMKDVASRIFHWKQHGKKLLVTGHSLGGYLAEVASTNFGLNGIAFCAPGPGQHNGDFKMQNFHYINMLFDPVVNWGYYTPFAYGHKDWGVFIGDELQLDLIDYPKVKFHRMDTMDQCVQRRAGWTNEDILSKCTWSWKGYYYTEVSDAQNHRRLRRSIRLKLPDAHTPSPVEPQVKWMDLPGFGFMMNNGGWTEPKYYETIQTVSIGHWFFVFGRGACDLHLASFNTKTNTWTLQPGFQFMTDSGGWDNPMYYETIRVLPMGYTLFVFGRGADALHLASFNTADRQWTQLPGFDYLTNKRGWSIPMHYKTVRVLPMGHSLFVFGRGGDMFHVASFNTMTNQWLELPGFAFMFNKAGWDKPMYYETIRIVTVAEKVFVFGRGAGELHLASFNTKTNTWALLPGLPFMTDKGGWGNPVYYETIRVVTVAEQVFVFGRGAGELHLASFNTKTNKWAQLPGFPFMTDNGGWNHPMYYKTIQVKSVADWLFVFGRGAGELHLAGFNTKTNTWALLPGFQFMTDKGGWGNPMYYETISVIEDCGDEAFVFGRGSDELHIASFA